MPRLLPDITPPNVAKMAGVTSVIALLAAGIVSASTYDHRVTLDVDGVVTDVRTTSTTVSDLLDDRGITVDADDKISLPKERVLSEGDALEIRTAKPVTLVVDGEVSQNVVHDWNVGDALETLKVTPEEDAYVSAGLTDHITASGTSLIVSNPKTLTVKADGKKKKVTTTEPTVAAVFKQVGISIGDEDEVKPGLGSYVKPDQALRVVRIETVVKNETMKVDFEVDVKKDSSLFTGERKVVTPGEKGEDKAKVKLVLADGKVRERVVISRSSVREPIAQVEKRGTKAKPKPKPKKVDNSFDGGVWDKLAQCESGGNWSANTGNGYYGGVQFSPTTWTAMGGSGLPHENSKAEQIRVATKLQKQSGWGQWPACTARLGLR